MANQRIVVDIIGNDSSFQAALARSQDAAAKFGSGVTRSLGSRSGVTVAAQFDPLLDRVRRSQAQADELSERLKQLDSGFEGSAQSAGSLGGALLPLIGRATAVGFAVNTAYQASRALSDALKVTGNEAFTTSGKLRNFGSALISGDLVGGIEALRAAPKTFDDLGISVTRARNVLDDLSRSGAKLEDLPKSTRDLIESMRDVVAAQDAAENSADALADSYARLGQVFRDVKGQAVLFKGSVDDLAGPRGPDAVDQINANLEQERAGRFRQAAQPDNRVNANKQILARANDDLDELLKLQTKERDRLRDAVKSKIGNEQERKNLQDAYVRAQADVIATGNAIKRQNEAEAKAAADAAAAAAKAAAEARKAAAAAAQNALEESWRKIIAALDIGVTRSQITAGLNDDLAALQDLKAGLERQIKAGVDVASAQARLAQTQLSIARKQEEIQQAAQAATQARQFRAIGLSVTGEDIVPGIQNLQTRIAAALRKFDSGDLNIGSKIVKQLKLAKALIAKEGDDVTRTTRDKINQILKAAEGGDTGSGAPRFRVPNFSDKFRDLGLTQQQLIALRSASASIGGPLIPQFAAQIGSKPSGTATIVNVNGNIVTNDSEKFIRDMERKAQRTAVARTGPMSGRQVS